MESLDDMAVELVIDGNFGLDGHCTDHQWNKMVVMTRLSMP